MTGRLQGRIALVTGASRGIGRAIAKRFCQEGATVVAVARTQGALEELDDEVRTDGRGTLVLVPEDLRNADKIDLVAAALYERFGKLDILVGNAGTLGTLGPMSHLKPKHWDDVLNTNLTVNWQLIRYMEPLLRQSDAGRAVFITSSVGEVPRAYWSAYAVSKAGLEMMVRTWAEELATSEIRANLYDPGGTRTRMRASAFPGEDPETVPPPEAHGDALVNLVVAECQHQGQRIAFKNL
jgi:NAD(P)-dependent dehydrogenase (short-subunit alcohol dehydrogenase family)